MFPRCCPTLNNTFKGRKVDPRRKPLVLGASESVDSAHAAFGGFRASGKILPPRQPLPGSGRHTPQTASRLIRYFR